MLRRKPRVRMVSTAPSVNFHLSLEARATEAVSTSKKSKVSSRLTSPSTQFLSTLSKSYGNSTYPLVQISQEDRIKKELYYFVSTLQFNNILKVFAGWDSWQAVLSRSEYSYFLKKLIKHQVGLMIEVSVLKSSMLYSEAKKTLIEAARFKKEIRDIYAKILLPGRDFTLYSNEAKLTLKMDPTLTLSDYENLITLEVYNGKLDLASDWFALFQKQFSKEYRKHMTLELWLLKFKALSEGSTHLWGVPLTPVYKGITKPRHYSYIRETSWKGVFTDFLRDEKFTGYIGNSEFNETLINVMAYVHDTTHIEKLIQSKWGITPSGEFLKDHPVYLPSHPSFPSKDILKAILVAFAYNRDLKKGMTYIDAFKTVYHSSVDLSSIQYHSLWGQIFRWADITTRFEPERVYGTYMKQNHPYLAKKGRAIAFEDAQNSPKFDSRKFLEHLDEFKKTRINTMQGIWDAYVEDDNSFSREAYGIYARYIVGSEEFNESLAYNYLTNLSMHYERFSVSNESFNKLHSHFNVREKTIKSFYTLVMKHLIDTKGKNAFMGTIPILIREWSLDKDMELHLFSYFDAKRPEYEVTLEGKRKKIMEEQREEVPFLDIM